MASSPEDLEQFRLVKPHIRTVMAFAFVLRHGFPHGAHRDENIALAYEAADCFIAQLEKDLQS